MTSEIIKVLLIDDDEDDYILTRELLSEVKVGKYSLDWASSYEEGLKVIMRREHHVCLVDYRLGERSGVQLIREAWESRLTTPMILLTGKGSHAVDVEAMQAGATDYLVKDETPTALLERTIRYAVELNTERTRAEEALAAYAQKQAAVAEIGRLALTGGELKDLFAEAAATVARTLAVEFCQVLELLPDSDSLTLRAGVGWKEDYQVGRATVSARVESQAGFTLLSEEPVVVEDLRTETRFGGPPLLHEHIVAGSMSVIIRGRERPFGVLGAHTTKVRSFAVDDVGFLSAIANVLAEAIARKKAEEDLRQSEARFRRVVESNVIGIFSSDPSGEISEANDAFLKMIGYTRADLAAGGIRWTEMTPPEYRQLDEKALKELTAHGVCDSYEKEYIRKDGSHVAILLRCALYEGGGNSGVGFALDISDRKRAEEAMRDSETRFSGAFEHGPIGVALVAPDGRWLKVNRALCDLVGYSEDDLLTRTFQDITHPEDLEIDLENVRRMLAGEIHTYQMEKRYVHARGHFVPVLLNVSLVRNAQSQPRYFISQIQDITERRIAEAERAHLLSQLESERLRLVDIFTHAPAFIASLRGPDHIFELANAHYYKLVGQRDLIGLKARDVFPEVEGQGFFELLDTVYATGVPFTGDEMPVELERVAGEPRELRYINLVYQPLTDVAGAISGIICHGVDVTEQVLSRRKLTEAENQLRQSQKLESVGMLAGGIAHDFNNLLTVITGYSDITLSGLDKDNPLARYVEEIKKAAERATSLTRQLLAFSRKQMLQPKVLDLNAVILDIEKMLGRLVGANMELCALPGLGLGRVKADPGQIVQVIVNLVVNARDAMPQGGKITLETANVYLDEAYALRHIAVQPGWYAMLAVTDTGHGIDAETMKSIFEPFFTTKEQGKGTGLGLSTVYGIVKQSGGTIWVYSEVGVGTSFKIYLPLIAEEVMEPDADAVSAEGTTGTETILLAEDEEMVRNLARVSLAMHGYTVLEAASGAAALLVAQEYNGPIHLLLTDVVMPRMSGKELAEQLVRLRPDLRVLYMSGYTDQAIVHHGILDEDIAFIEKPFTPAGLLLKVADVLQQYPGSNQTPEGINSLTPAGSKERVTHVE